MYNIALVSVLQHRHPTIKHMIKRSPWQFYQSSVLIQNYYSIVHCISYAVQPHSCSLFYNWKIISLNPLHLFHPTPLYPQPALATTNLLPVSIHFYKDWMQNEKVPELLYTNNEHCWNKWHLHERPQNAQFSDCSAVHSGYRGDSFWETEEWLKCWMCGSMEG